MPPITTGLVLWLDADDPSTLTVVGGNTVSWADKSTSAVTFYLPIENPAPTLNETYFPRPCVDFGDGSSSVWMTADATVTISRPATIFFVVYWPEIGTSSALALQSGSGISALETPTSSSSVFMFSTPSLPGSAQISIAPYLPEGQVYTPASVSSNAGHVVTFQAAVAPADSGIRFDGVAQTVATEGPTHYPAMSFDTIGSSDWTYLANGAFAEILVYDGALSTAEIESVEAYLTAKWSSSGGTSVDVELSGVSGTAAAGDVIVSTGGAIDVEISGVSADAATSDIQAIGSAGVLLSGGQVNATAGELLVRYVASVPLSGVQATAGASQVLVWSAVADAQTPNWQNILS